MEERQGTVIISVDEAKLNNSARKMIKLNTALLADLVDQDDWELALKLFSEYLSVLVSRWQKGDKGDKGWSTDKGWTTE